MSRSGRAASLLVAGLSLLLAAGCGSADTDPANDAPDEGIPSIRSWLGEHTSDLVGDASRIRAAADGYSGLVRTRKGNYRKLVRRDCRAVAGLLNRARNALLRGRQDYGEIDVLVAGIPRLSQYDTDLATGSTSSDPADSVSFALKAGGRRVVPGRSLFYLLEASLYGTDRRLAARGGNPDTDCDGRSRFGEGLPDAATFRGIAYEFLRQTRDLNQDAGEIVVTESDAFTAMIRALPLAGPFIRQWRNSAFVRGPGPGTEREHVAASRLSGLADLLSGVAFVYSQVRPAIAEREEDRAAAIRDSLSRLSVRAADLRDREASGREFTPVDADRIGATIGMRAEMIADRLRTVASRLEIGIQSP